MRRNAAVMVLVSVAAIAALLLAGLNSATRERIANNEAQQLIAAIDEVLPGPYDNSPHEDVAITDAAEALGADALPVYRARRDGRPAGLALVAVAPDGYVDVIRLLIGIGPTGRVTGVRVVRHAETPGLGDGIDVARSDWILAFDDRSADSPASKWALRRDGGDFDQLTGATITSRAVVNAVRRALDYYALHRDELYALASTGTGSQDDD